VNGVVNDWYVSKKAFSYAGSVRSRSTGARELPAPDFIDAFVGTVCFVLRVLTEVMAVTRALRVPHEISFASGSSCTEAISLQIGRSSSTNASVFSGCSMLPGAAASRSSSIRASLRVIAVVRRSTMAYCHDSRSHSRGPSNV